MLKKPRSGDNWYPSASREGKIADAVNWVIGRQRAIGPGDGGDAPDTGRCLAANGTCDDFALYDAVQIDSPITLPGDSEPAWSEGIPAYRVLTPESANARIAILIDPLPTCTMRRAIVSGICRTKVDILDAAHKWATVAVGSRRLISTSNANAPCEIIWHEAGTGERLADVLLSTRHAAPAVPEPSVTPASPVDGVLNDCAGRCKFIWSASLSKWIKSEADSTCGRRTTTTGTSTSSTSSTTGSTTEEAEPCCPWAARESEIPTTTTTPDPEGTTTPDDCDCLWPTFCGTADGQCAYTDCVSGVTNQEPVCGTTTPAATSSTTCDCDNTAVPPDCTIGCDWVGLPISATTWAWRKVSDGCSSNCPCPEPDTDPFCNSAHTDCEIIIPPTDPLPPGCTGQCTYWWLPAIDAWYYVGGNCNAGFTGCGCQPPSYDGSDCAPTIVPCAAPPAGSTTAGDPPAYDPCVYACFGVGTTSTSTSTTPDADCQTGGCVWDWNGASTWVLILDECPGALGCYCLYPGRDGLDDCEVLRTGCTHIDEPPTSTSSTTPPPTTTSSSTTGTTTQPPCPEGQAALRCVGMGGDLYVWQQFVPCEVGAGDYDVTNCGPCTEPGVGQVCCVDCTTTTSTTTTTPEGTTTPEPTTTTPEPTTTATSSTSSTTPTTTPEPTSTSTTSTTTTTPEGCPPCPSIDNPTAWASNNTIWGAGNWCVWQFYEEAFHLVEAGANCTEGCEEPSQDPGATGECECLGAPCATTTTSTTTQEACNGQGEWSCEWDSDFMLWSWMLIGHGCGGFCGEGYTCQPAYPGGGCDAEHENDMTYSNCECVEDSA